MDTGFLVCTDCGGSFEFSDSEQQAFAARGFSTPKRCRTCRAAKRRRQANHAPAAAAGAIAVQSAPERPRPRPRPAAEMHSATCTVCSALTEVPFRPDGVRPIFCLPCLKQRTR